MKRIILFMGILVTMAFTGCSNTTTVPAEKSNLTVGMIKSRVVKGETTQNDILNIFGSPNLITKNRSDREVWSYNKMSTEGAESSGGWSVLFAGSSHSARNTTTNTFDFIVTFDDEDVVEDYSIISSSY